MGDPAARVPQPTVDLLRQAVAKDVREQPELIGGAGELAGDLDAGRRDSGRCLVHRDEINATVRGRRGARLLAQTSGGAIPAWMSTAATMLSASGAVMSPRSVAMVRIWPRAEITLIGTHTIRPSQPPARGTRDRISQGQQVVRLASRPAKHNPENHRGRSCRGVRPERQRQRNLRRADEAGTLTETFVLEPGSQQAELIADYRRDYGWVEEFDA